MRERQDLSSTMHDVEFVTLLRDNVFATLISLLRSRLDHIL